MEHGSSLDARQEEAAMIEAKKVLVSAGVTG